MSQMPVTADCLNSAWDSLASALNPDLQQQQNSASNAFDTSDAATAASAPNGSFARTAHKPNATDAQTKHAQQTQQRQPTQQTATNSVYAVQVDIASERSNVPCASSVQNESPSTKQKWHGARHNTCLGLDAVDESKCGLKGPYA
eukprot:6177177-Pleurochrysis_carterae.AAC.1